MEYLFRFIAAAIGNRIRGGLLKDHGYLNSKVLQAIGSTGIFLIICAVIFTQRFELAIALAMLAGLYVGETLGWGRYIGALMGTEDKPPKEVGFIDEILKDIGLEPKYKSVNQHVVEYDDIKALRVWGFMGLTLRGAFWGLCMTLAVKLALVVAHLFNYDIDVAWSALLLPPAFGGLMGVCYFATIEFAKRFLGDVGKGWPLGEYLFGGVFILGCTL